MPDFWVPVRQDSPGGKRFGGHRFSRFQEHPFAPISGKRSSGRSFANFEGHASRFFRTFPGGPCNSHHKCSSDKSVCRVYIGREVCLVMRQLDESCNKWYEVCAESVCRVDKGGSGKKCMGEDHEADTGEICTDSRPCLEGNECMSCDWVPNETRCVKVIDDEEVCDQWFQICKPTAKCEYPAEGRSATCVPLPSPSPSPSPSATPPVCLSTADCPVEGCILSDDDCPCDGDPIKNCGDFPSRQHAQLCLEKCGTDVHGLDGSDNDGVACEGNKFACIRPPPAADAESCPTDTACPPPGCLIPDSLCPCDEGDTKRCNDFPTKELVQACLAKCLTDPHRLDRDKDGVACLTRPACGSS